MSTKNTNKVIYGGETFIDLSTDTLTSDRILSGITHHKTTAPSTSEQAGLSDEGYRCSSQVMVLAIPYIESKKRADGITVTIAG